VEAARGRNRTWRAHTTECHAWVVRLADEILAKSQMEPFPVSQFGTPNVNHLKLGLFVYRRLFRFSQHSVLIHARNAQNDQWVIEGFQGTSAEGTEQQLRALVSMLDGLVAREKETADSLQAKARTVEQKLSALRSELNYPSRRGDSENVAILYPSFERGLGVSKRRYWETVGPLQSAQPSMCCLNRLLAS
jgi:hypothetical protein